MSTTIVVIALLDPAARHRAEVWPVRIGNGAHRLTELHGMSIEHVPASGDLPRIMREQEQRGVAALVIADIYGLGWGQEIGVYRPGIPTVFIGVGPGPTGIPSVLYDQEQAGSDAATALLDGGAQRIAWLGALDWEWARLRERGAAAALARRGLPQLTRVSRTAGQEMEHALVANGLGLGWGVLALDGTHGRQAARALLHLGLRSVRVICFDDISEADSLEISTVDPPLEEVGLIAAQTILAMLKGRPVESRTVVSGQIIVRWR
jgi:DNA-binding LacI/PurR family transcriptional regulator